MQNENNFEKHEKLKKKLKIAGFVLVIVGAVLALAAFIDFFITVGNRVMRPIAFFHFPRP